MKLAVSSLLVGSAAAFSLDMKAGEDYTCRKSFDKSTIGKPVLDNVFESLWG